MIWRISVECWRRTPWTFCRPTRLAVRASPVSLQVGALCQARSMQLSAHCVPTLHVHPCCSVIPLRHLEYFHDHVRIERMLFDGLPELADGELRPDLSRPGIGLEIKRPEAERYRVWAGDA